MQKVFYSLFLLTLFIPQAVHAEAPDKAAISVIIPGSDDYKRNDCAGVGSFSYDNYSVFVAPSPEFFGNSIYVFKPADAMEPPCGPNLKKAVFYLEAGEYGGANVFAGMYGGLLFVDQWTGRDFKRILIFDVEKKSLLLVSEYVDPHIESDVLYYKRTLKAGRSVVENVPCPDAGTWKADGREVLYTEKMSFDLTDRVKHGTDEFGCQSAAPIEGAKKGIYGN